METSPKILRNQADTNEQVWGGACLTFPFLVFFYLLTSCVTPQSSVPPESAVLAVANEDAVRILDVPTGQPLHTVTRYREVFDLAYRPDGNRLAVTECFGHRVVELETNAYTEDAAPFQAPSCPWDLSYSPDNASLAASLPFRASPTSGLVGHLNIIGPHPLDQNLGTFLPALAYRPGGQELAVATPQGLLILSTSPGYPVLHTLPAISSAKTLKYTLNGARLLVGTESGLLVLDAAAQYVQVDMDTLGAVVDVALDPTGSWLAVVRQSAVSIRRTPDLVEVSTISTPRVFRDADFSPGGSILAMAENEDSIRLFQAPTWNPLTPISLSGRIRAVAFQPQSVQRIPVLVVHGHCRGGGTSWFEANPVGAGTSLASALASNPTLPIDVFYLELPVHKCGLNDPVPPPQVLNRSIAEDAEDILAVIEGGVDSHGAQQVGILNMPGYQALGKVGIIAYSQGAISSRYYLKNLMGNRRGGAITVSEFVSLAAPNHGVGGVSVCGEPLGQAQQDRARRQLCGGLTATGASFVLPCGDCTSPLGIDRTPPAFSMNAPGDDTFLLNLNGGYPWSDSCSLAAHPEEAPHSRLPNEPVGMGVLYVNLFAENNEDLFVGGDTHQNDCVGRRLARNLAPGSEVTNMEISGVPGPPTDVHGNFPHHWPTLCFALRTVVDQQPPGSPTQACQTLTAPP